MSSNSGRGRGRGGNSSNKRSQAFAKSRAEKQKAESLSLAPLTISGSSSRANAPKRIEWESHGPGVNCMLKPFPHTFVISNDATLVAAEAGEWWYVDLFEYFQDKADLNVNIKSLVILFMCTHSDGFYDVVRASSAVKAKECFSTLTSKRFEKDVRLGTQFLAPHDLTFSMLKENMFFLIMKFTEPLVAGQRFMTRRLWGHSNKMPEAKIPEDVLML